MAPTFPLSLTTSYKVDGADRGTDLDGQRAFPRPPETELGFGKEN